MQDRVTTISRALMMGFAWAAVWVPAGMIGGQIVVGELEPEHIGGPLYASVLCGAIFSALAGVASGRRRLGDLSFAQAATRGGLTGLVVGALPFLIGDQHAPTRPLWVLPALVMSAMTAACVLTAAVSAPVARWWSRLSHGATP
jgi:hypothetical protein